MPPKDAIPKVKNPHPLMQQGTPAVDIEFDHISMFTVFRLGGGGAPKHVETLSDPRQYLEPGSVRALVGGGDYIVKALANPHTSGRSQNSVIAATNFSWDGPPNIRVPPTAQPPAAPPPAQALIEQASSQLPALLTGIGSLATAALAFLSEQRNARAADEQRRREYDDARRKEEQLERERRDAKEKAEAEERREREARRDEERRETARLEAEERRAEQARVEQARNEQARLDSEARQARETMLLNAMMNRKDPNEAIMQILVQRALNPPAAAPAGPSIDGVLDAAKKLKDFAEGDSIEKLLPALVPLAATPVGQAMMARVGGIVGLVPPEMLGQAPQQVVTPEPQQVEQLPPAAPPQQEPEAQPQPQPIIQPGPVTYVQPPN